MSNTQYGRSAQYGRFAPARGVVPHRWRALAAAQALAVSNLPSNLFDASGNSNERVQLCNDIHNNIMIVVPGSTIHLTPLALYCAVLEKILCALMPEGHIYRVPHRQLARYYMCWSVCSDMCMLKETVCCFRGAAWQPYLRGSERQGSRTEVFRMRLRVRGRE